MLYFLNRTVQKCGQFHLDNAVFCEVICGRQHSSKGSAMWVTIQSNVRVLNLSSTLALVIIRKTFTKIQTATSLKKKPQQMTHTTFNTSNRLTFMIRGRRGITESRVRYVATPLYVLVEIPGREIGIGRERAISPVEL